LCIAQAALKAFRPSRCTVPDQLCDDFLNFLALVISIEALSFPN